MLDNNLRRNHHHEYFVLSSCCTLEKPQNEKLKIEQSQEQTLERILKGEAGFLLSKILKSPRFEFSISLEIHSE